MTTKKKLTSTVLLSVSVISTLLAIYFGFKYYNLNANEGKNTDDFESNRKSDEQYEQASKKIDSLILVEEYVAAEALLKELKAVRKVQTDLGSEARSKLLSTLINTKKENQAIVKNRIAGDSVNKNEVPVDSLLKEELITKLNSAKSKVRSLQNQLTKTAENEYLTFKTSKGTGLHYVGQVKKHKANGFGIALLETGSRYEGTWKNNLRDGYGKFYWDDGEHYEGAYKNDKREGQGTYFWKNGERYTGEWKDDQRNGHGEFYNKKGKIKASGTWEKDKLVQEDK
ncbi:hypothetical protein NBT05_07555 [Aquimarina sp. ERC-38]|uniref:MORN repeat-containing protein n=1 Tax=Aquimarina sp. ERC-38 TaxID=2949996 RepID=UPI00224511C3|nr:hypothetical protein [Aquimarina sp. ERC-38]UZO82321.1 hypothetical protein NBT05_07555 [Aquimarina sp. ERC-38]